MPGLQVQQDKELMASIRERWEGAIRAACATEIGAGTPSFQITPAFLAALVGNESGGDETAYRFEPGVHRHLLAVREGQEPHYGSIVREHLQKFSGLDLELLSVSWGLTQIMGYHELPGGKAVRLVDGAYNLKRAATLLRDFAGMWKLDPAKDFEQLLHCWNTGRPGGKTFDPEYAARGLARMQLY